MKIFKFLAVALVAMLGFTACDKDCDHNFIEVDYSKELVGTWTYIADNGQAEAMVINPDGSFEVTGVMKGGHLYEEKGTVKVLNNKVSLVFEGDTDVIEGRLELVSGKSLSIVLNEEYDIRLDYDYCKEDLSEEIVGMWVCTNSFANTENDMLIQTFNEDGTAIMTGYISDLEDFVTNAGGSTYKVIGNLFINILPADAVAGGVPPYMAMRLDYTPNGLAYGDIMTFTHYLVDGIKNTDTFLRVKQNLNLTGNTYDYKSAYVTNVKGKDEDFTIFGNTFNIAKIKPYDFDKLFSADLFSLDLNATSIKQNFNPSGENEGFPTPITVDGNKVTLDFSAENPACRKVDMYMFQDKDDTQLHIYMPAKSFINYFANLEILTMLLEGKINPNDAVAVEKVFTDMGVRVESINVSLVFKARK